MGLLIKNGTIVTAVDEFVGDIFIEGEKINAIGKELNIEADQVMDAKGKYVLPGGIDQHVHYSFDFKGERVRGFETSNAAIAGGTTTVIEFVNQEQGKGIAETIEQYDKEEVSKYAMADYSFHGVICDPRDEVFEEIQSLPEKGITTVKLFMAYKGLPFHSDDESIYKALRASRDAGVTVMVHAENADVIDTLQKECVEAGNTSPYYHAVSRPPLVEVEATQRAINLAKMADAPIYIVHVTAKEVMESIREAHNEGYPIYGETCTHYLVLDKEDLAKPNFEGAKYVCSPALRSEKDRTALWEAINKGWLNAVSSDHCGFNWKTQKHMGIHDFTNIPNGSPGVQDRLEILWTYGVNKGIISKQRLVDLFSTTPAKNNGLIQKGHLGVGYDADIVIYDPDHRRIISNDNSLHGVDYNTYEGMTVEGRVKDVFLRGKRVVSDGQFIGEYGDGKFLHSEPYGLCYEGQEKKETSTSS
ncbi:dihydropyrimidinase [Alteribacillus iranensis]|uniref:Dihydropyrimidinase n=1 Tax=Alteribacillus iranensis TaxID=930128 RepID=A0A1I2CP83_9BACI|nr:dihydropyrimidinase [Alteribacillus iranensis]SFE70121.1 dihydropyrimidinase [Alteribacillus iranensis]